MLNGTYHCRRFTYRVDHGKHKMGHLLQSAFLELSPHHVVVEGSVYEDGRFDGDVAPIAHLSAPPQHGTGVVKPRLHHEGQ